MIVFAFKIILNFEWVILFTICDCKTGLNHLLAKIDLLPLL